MAVKYASFYKRDHNKSLNRVSLGDSDNTVEGSAVTWVQDTALTAARTITVRDFDQSRHGEYDDKLYPKLVIKCAVDASVNNLVVADTAAAVLFTFAADYSVTPAYCVLRLDSVGDWELA